MSQTYEQSDLSCPQCGYNLTGLTASACPECGLKEVAVRAHEAQQMPPYRSWLHRFAVALVICTFILVSWGGSVTSKDMGLSVPDAPNTFGHIMFFAPPSLWWDAYGAFWEHMHRLIGSLVGFLAIIMCWSLIMTQKPRTWLRWFGMLLLASVIWQGLMGIWRVTEISQWWAIAHGIMGQLVLCMTVVVAAATSRWWMESRKPAAHSHTTSEQWPAQYGAMRTARKWSIALLAVLFIQLTLGATMRHTKAGLAIPDFPANFGQVVPPMTQNGVDEAVMQLAQTQYDHPTVALAPVASQVHHNYSHRVWSIVVCLVAFWCMTKVAGAAKDRRRITVPALLILFFIVVQMTLGALVVWLQRQPPDIATAHQANGAVILALCVLLMLRLHVLPAEAAGTPCCKVSGNHQPAGAQRGKLQLKGAGA